MPDSLFYAEGIVQTVREPLVVLDSNLRVRTANRAFYRTFKVSPGQTEGGFVYELGSGQWDIAPLRRLLEEVLPQDSFFEDFEVSHDFPLIGQKTMLLNARVLSGPGGDENLILLAIEDVTERKRAEERLQAFARELQRSNRELQDFASVASHDLQEPLRKIQTFSDELLETYADQLGEDGRDTLRRLHAASGRMRTLINDLLAFSRVSTKAQPFAPVDLDAAARDALSDLETRLEETGAGVELSGLPTIEADPLQMRQLLQNLLGNALKFRRPDTRPQVRVGAEVADGLCRLTVSDNGIGFDEKYLDRIFTVFQRLHGRGEYEGTGVGLAICRKIAERHGGQITARSAPGAGATFVVTLPVKQPAGETV